MIKPNFLQVFVSNEFDPTADFSNTYTEILDVTTIPTEVEQVYNVTTVKTARFVILEQREIVFTNFHINELEILTIVNSL